MSLRKKIGPLLLTASCTTALFCAGCAEPERLPAAFLEPFERSGNLESLADPCSGLDLPGLPGVKSGWIQQSAEATTLQFSNLALSCDEEPFVAEDGSSIVDLEDCGLPHVAWWNYLSLALPPLDEVKLGKPYLQPQPKHFDGPPRNFLKLVHPGKRGCGLMIGSNPPQTQVSLVIEARTPSCVAGRISGVGVVDMLAHSTRYLFSPDGRFVAQRCTK